MKLALSHSRRPSANLADRDLSHVHRWAGWSRPGVVALLLLCVVWVPATASAQMLGGPRPQSTAARKTGILSRFLTTVDVAHLTGTDADDRFNWDTDLAVDLDAVDFGVVRANIFANIETTVGSERRGVDPNQTGYTLDATVFLRLPRGELASTFHHVSRHRSDRESTESVSWNMVGVGYAETLRLGVFGVKMGARGLSNVGRNGVDYDGQFDANLNLERAITGDVALIVGADGVIVSVDQSKFGRDTLRGGRLEAGVRLLGAAASLDVFVAWEQRIDAAFAISDTTRWTHIGFRLAAPASSRQ